MQFLTSWFRAFLPILGWALLTRFQPSFVMEVPVAGLKNCHFRLRHALQSIRDGETNPYDVAPELRCRFETIGILHTPEMTSCHRELWNQKLAQAKESMAKHSY